jgi:tetratricopeptide (TPR) repeat protein
MHEKDWWLDYGPFKRWNECPTRPHPVDVLLFYLEKRGIDPGEHVAYLMDTLDLQKSMAYNVLRGEGFDSISRCRLLVQALKIPPPLLGIDVKYYPIGQHAYWWSACGFSFHADAQGYPLMSEVVAYLRIQRTQITEEGKIKVWSQEDLGDATGLKKETVYRMEHDKNPLVLESMSRRVTVASVLGQLSGEMEATIFRLFGLDPQAYGVPTSADDAVPMIHLPHPQLTDAFLQECHQKLAASFTDYYTCHGENAVGQALEWMAQLPSLLPLAVTTAQRVSLLALQARNHHLLLGVAREQCDKERILLHMQKALDLVEQAMTLPDPHSTADRALLVTTNELLATTLLWRAQAYYDLAQYEQAQAELDRALNLLPSLQSNQLKRHILIDAGLIHAHTATTPMDQALVLSYFNLAAQITAFGHSQPPDENFIRCDNGLLYLRKAMALSAPNMKGTTAEKVGDLLEKAQRLMSPELIRWQALAEVFLAQAHFAAGEYQQATEVAISALEKCSQIRSRLNRNRIDALYQQLLHTPFKDKPLLSYLGMKLRTWDHGMD